MSNPNQGAGQPTLVFIPSYNQALTALRCFGIFEALMEILAYQADQQITTGSTQEIQDKKQRVLNNIEAIKLNAFANTFGINVDGTTKKMSLQDYNQLKWYVSQAEKDSFSPL